MGSFEGKVVNTNSLHCPGIEHTLQKIGKLDGAVNMAGIIRPAKPITESTEGDWDFIFAVNARGVFNCLVAELKAMSPGGSIVSRLPF
jgi:NAD(P)-dependent dehydrogenase (short-subunit alcohol dehydrogenase family)